MDFEYVADRDGLTYYVAEPSEGEYYIYMINYTNRSKEDIEMWNREYSVKYINKKEYEELCQL